MKPRLGLGRHVDGVTGRSCCPFLPAICFYNLPAASRSSCIHLPFYRGYSTSVIPTPPRSLTVKLLPYASFPSISTTPLATLGRTSSSYFHHQHYISFYNSSPLSQQHTYQVSIDGDQGPLEDGSWRLSPTSNVSPYYRDKFIFPLWFYLLQVLFTSLLFYWLSFPPSTAGLTISKDHPESNIIGDPHEGVRTRRQLVCGVACYVSMMEPKNIEEVLLDDY